jgi:hypothetical protein
MSAALQRQSLLAEKGIDSPSTTHKAKPETVWFKQL